MDRSSIPDGSFATPVNAVGFHTQCNDISVYTDTPNSSIQVEEGIVLFANTNLVVRTRGSQPITPTHIGPLSIIFTAKGQDVYEVDGRRLVVDESCYLVHNLGQSIASHDVVDQPLDSFVIGFWPGFAEDVLRSLVTPADQLLDAPAPDKWQPVRFFDQLYPHDTILTPQLQIIRNIIEQNLATPGWLEEQNHLLLERLLHVHRNIGREIESLPPIRASTRVELYHRLHRARDFMVSNLHRPITLAQTADSAWFSPHHFLRAFKQVFHETPHQYLTRKRLEKAKWLLEKTDQPISEICLLLGFESLGSFSWLFRRSFGLSPTHFRQVSQGRRE